MTRRFPQPSSVEEMDACIIVRDANGLPLACVEGEPGQRPLVRGSRASAR